MYFFCFLFLYCVTSDKMKRGFVWQFFARARHFISQKKCIWIWNKCFLWHVKDRKKKRSGNGHLIALITNTNTSAEQCDRHSLFDILGTHRLN